MINNIRFLFVYISILLVLQMLFFSIYNIPIYKIYCDLNNYYFYNSSEGISRDKYYLYLSSNEFCNSINMNKCLVDNSLILGIKDYLLPKELYNSIEVLEEKNINIYTNIIYFINKKLYSSFTFSLPFITLNKNITTENLNNFLYIITFKASTTNVNLVEFISLQNNIYIVPGETYLIFFRIYNPTNYIIKGISIYFISPNEINLYLFKIQCFCFDELLLYEFESVDLPILFYIVSDIIYINVELFMYFQIHITYLFILSSF